MTDKFVSTLDGMTAEWFTSILSAARVLDGSVVERIELEPFGGGVMTNMIRAQLYYTGEGGGPASVLVKYPSEDEGNLGIAQIMGLYELEVRFYQDIAPRLPHLSAPRCYAAEFDANTGRFILVVEDLSAKTKPGTTLDSLTGDECSAVFRELANFQAPLWNSPVLAEFDWLADPQRTLGFFDAIPAGMAPYLNRFGHALDPDHVRLIETVLPHAGKWPRSWQAPKVLQHGEFRAGNILFGTTPDAAPVTVIDFQTVRVGPPGIDPAYFMGASLPIEDRRKLERDLLTEYHQRLLSAGVSGFDWDACWKSYRAGAMYGIYLYVGMAGQVEPSERNDRMILDISRRLLTMAVDLDSITAAGL